MTVWVVKRLVRFVLCKKRLGETNNGDNLHAYLNRGWEIENLEREEHSSAFEDKMVCH